MMPPDTTQPRTEPDLDLTDAEGRTVDPAVPSTLVEGDPVVAVPESDLEVETEPAPGGGIPERAAHVADPSHRRAILPWLLACSVIAVLGLASLGASFTPLFSAKTISVSGQRHLSRTDVLQEAGLDGTVNVVHTDLGAAERRLEQDPWVANASITRSLPSTLRVVVRERVPTALAGGGVAPLVYVASDGAVIGEAPAGTRMPRLISPVGAAVPEAADLQTGASVAAAMPAALLPRIASIAVEPNGQITVHTDRGVVVTYGDASQLAAKAQSLRAVLDWAVRESTPITTVDVTVPGAPTAGLPGGVLVTR